MDGCKMDTALRTIDTTITEQMLAEFSTDEEAVYGLIFMFIEQISLVNVQNYIRLYSELNNQYPINIHQFCKFIPAEYRAEFKSFLLPKSEG